MKKRKIFLMGFVSLIAAAVLWSVGMRVYYQRQFDARVAELKAAGFPVSLEDLEKAYVLPEGAANAADVYIEAFSHYQEPNELELEWLPYVGDYEIAEDNSELPAAVMDTMAAFVAKNSQTLELLDKASTIETCLWPKTRQDCMLFNDYLSEIKDSVKLLQLRNVYLSEKKDINAVNQSLKSTIALANTFDIEPFLIDHLFCIALKSTTVRNLNDALSRMSVDTEKMEYFQQEFARMQDVDKLYDAFVIDRIYSLEFSQLKYDLQKKNTLQPPSYIFQLIYSMTGLNKKDYYLSLLKTDEYIEAAQLPLHERSAAFKQIDESDRLAFWLFYLMGRTNFQGLVNIDLRVIGNLRCAETALAVERYRLKYGGLPESLEGLVPEFMGEAPRDPFDGAVLRYVRDDVGYTIYTIGADGVDNGGLSEEQMETETGQSDPEEYDWPFRVTR